MAKFAIITGGSSGINKSIARRCLDHGANVFIVARDQARLDAAIAVSLRHDFGRVEDQGRRIVRIIDRNRDLVLEQKQDACEQVPHG